MPTPDPMQPTAQEHYDIVSWNEWGEYKALYGVEIVRVIWPEFMEGLVRPTVVARKVAQEVGA